MRQVRTAGILIELDENGNLRLRAPNEPPQATVEHLRQHKRELVQFLEAKVEDAEHRIVAREQQRTSWVSFRSGGSAGRYGRKRCPSSRQPRRRKGDECLLPRPRNRRCRRACLAEHRLGRIAADEPLPNAMVERLRRDKPEMVEVVRLLPACECGATLLEPVSAWWGG